VAAVAYSVLAVARHETYRSTGFDLGIFDQVVWHLSNFDAPASSLKGLGSIFGDHFSPILIAFAPLYWIWSSPVMLLVAQAVLVSAAALPIHAFARWRVGEWPALGIVVGYLLFGGVQQAIWFDFHEVAAAPLLIALAVLAADRQRWAWAVVATLALLTVKEDMSFLVVAFGAYFALLGQRRLGAGVAGAGIGWYFLATSVVIPHFSDGASYTYWSYTQLGPNAPHAVLNVVKAPWKLVDVGFSPSEKVKTTAYMFGAFGGLSLLSPLVVLTVPLLAERMLSTNAAYWSTHGHYSLTIAPVLALAAADGLPRAVRVVPVARLAPAAIALLAVALIPAFPLKHLAQPSYYRDASDASPALALVPAGASVSATNHLVPHLAHRDDIELVGPHAPRTQVVVADIQDGGKSAVFPNSGLAALRRVVAGAPGYRRAYAAHGVIVLRR
jgi:uncharacterized membrane protein